MLKTKFSPFFFLLVFAIVPWPASADTSASSTIGDMNTATATAPTLTIGNSAAISTTTAGSVLGLQAPAKPPLIQAIENAKAQLVPVSLNHALTPVSKNIKNKKTKKTTKVITGYNLTAKDIALAILDPATQNVTIVKGMQTGKTMTFNDPAADVKLTSFNGVNSRFSVSRPAGGTVIALKYLITGTESSSKAAIENSISEAIYVPYSPALSSPDVVAYGANYLNGVIRQVTAGLQGLPSQAVPGKTITEAIKPSLVKALVYAEHTDTGKILSGNQDDILGTIDQLNILFATNEEDTYRYSVSSAGARGIAQFMPSTYASLVQRHPEAALNPDFVAGMSDHVNAIKAMYLLIDDYAGTVRVKAQQGYAEGQLFDYGAASYNGGTTRVAKAVNAFGQNWNADRSGEIASMQAQINSLSSQSKTLASKIKKAKDKKTKADLQAQLSQVKNQLASTSNQLDTMQSATLRNETVNYLKKIYNVIHVFNDQQI